MKTRLAPAGSTVGAGRRALCDELTKRGVASDPIDMVELMASELLTNAVLYSGGEVRLLLSTDEYRIRVEVIDQSPVPPMLRHPPSDSSSGRGMQGRLEQVTPVAEIVDALAPDWGVNELPGGGKSVWFEVSR